MLNETRWFTRRTLRNFLFVLLPSLVLTLLGSLVSPQQPLAQTEADPGKLPAAARQVPDWDAYGSIAGVGVRHPGPSPSSPSSPARRRLS